MSDLKGIERINLEKFFDMGSGYVCNFSDRTFKDFVLEVTGLDIYSEGYDSNGTSKANRLRLLWKKGSNYLVSKLLMEMLEYWRDQKIISEDGISQAEQYQYEKGIEAANRLKSDTSIENVSAIKANSEESDFALLGDLIRESLARGNPSSDLDRLHTFVTKYIRTLCDKHVIVYTKEISLHSLFGGYVKSLEEKKLIESAMSLRILKSSISILDAFNDVRNNKSFAHDNPILNGDEAILIVSNISTTIRFIEALEVKVDDVKKKKEELPTINFDDIVF